MKKYIYTLFILLAAAVHVNAQESLSTLKIKMELTNHKKGSHSSYEPRSLDYSISRNYADSSQTDVTMSFILDQEDPFLIHWLADTNPDMRGVITFTNLGDRKAFKTIAFKNIHLLNQAVTYMYAGE